MAVTLVTGELGSGKTLVTVGIIRDALLNNLKVATNLDVYLDELMPLSHERKENIIRLPDFPTSDVLWNLPRPTESKNEEDFGVIVLDESAIWLDSRNWQNRDRTKIKDWLLHSRKLGWHIYLIAQNMELIDKQIRKAVVEMVGYCRRMDRVKIPFFGMFTKLAGFKGVFPQVHICTIKYGKSSFSPVFDRKIYKAKHLYNAYDTNQVFDHENTETISSFLPSKILRMRINPIKKLLLYVRGYTAIIIISTCLSTLYGASLYDKYQSKPKEKSKISEIAVTGYSASKGKAIVYLEDDTYQTTNVFYRKGADTVFIIGSKQYIYRTR